MNGIIINPQQLNRRGEKRRAETMFSLDFRARFSPNSRLMSRAGTRALQRDNFILPVLFEKAINAGHVTRGLERWFTFTSREPLFYSRAFLHFRYARLERAARETCTAIISWLEVLRVRVAQLLRTWFHERCLKQKGSFAC